MFKFRGIKTHTDEFVYGNGIFCEDQKIYILDKSGNYISIKPETYSIGYPVLNAIEYVYVGDIIRYTFKHKEDYYNQYYVINHLGNVPYMSELYRDYELNDDLQAVRGKFYSHQSEVKQLTNMTALRDTYAIVGDIWHNKELLK